MELGTFDDALGIVEKLHEGREVGISGEDAVANLHSAPLKFKPRQLENLLDDAIKVEPL